MASNLVRFDEIRSQAAASITNSFVGLGYITSPSTPAPFTHAMRVLNFRNPTDGDIAVSFDGVTVNDVIPAGSFSLYDLTSDEDTNEMFRYQNGTQVYIKWLVQPTKETFYLTAIYGKGE